MLVCGPNSFGGAESKVECTKCTMRSVVWIALLLALVGCGTKTPAAAEPVTNALLQIDFGASPELDERWQLNGWAVDETGGALVPPASDKSWVYAAIPAVNWSADVRDEILVAQIEVKPSADASYFGIRFLTETDDWYTAFFWRDARDMKYELLRRISGENEKRVRYEPGDANEDPDTWGLWKFVITSAGVLRLYSGDKLVVEHNLKTPISGRINSVGFFNRHGGRQWTLKSVSVTSVAQ